MMSKHCEDLHCYRCCCCCCCCFYLSSPLFDCRADEGRVITFDTQEIAVDMDREEEEEEDWLKMDEPPPWLRKELKEVEEYEEWAPPPVQIREMVGLYPLFRSILETPPFLYYMRLLSQCTGNHCPRTTS